jgi:hypothetical protein
VPDIRTVAGVCCVAMLLSACQGPEPRQDDGQLRTAREQITELQDALARARTTAPNHEGAGEDRTAATATPLDWQDREIPAAARRGFEHPQQLLGVLAGEVISLRTGEGGDSALLRLLPRAGGFVGDIVERNLPDDAAGAHQYRAVIVKRDRRWFVAALTERVICRRGGSGETCL